MVASNGIIFTAELSAPVSKARRPARPKTMHTLYILLCADDSYYTGITRKLPRRLAQHNKGEVIYTATRLPVQLVYREKFAKEEEAVKREQQIKGWTRRKKIALIAAQPGILRKLAKKTNWPRNKKMIDP